MRGALENASEKTAELVDNEIKRWLDDAYSDATKLLTKNKKTVEKLATQLLERETLTGDEIREIVFGKKQSKTTTKTTKITKTSKQKNAKTKK